MLQETLLRASAIPGASNPVIVCGAAHYLPIAEQLDEVEVSARAVLLEPIGRGTAPAAAAAALAVDEDDILIVMPADHAIDSLPGFMDSISRAVAASRTGWLVTFGVNPDRPETGYGYIERGGAIENLSGAYRISSFHEKPDLETAQHYLETGRHSWNSGMFVFQAGRYLEELRTISPEIVQFAKDALAASTRYGESLLVQGGALLDPQLFSSCPSGSIDRTVMERTRRGATVPLQSGWNDLGSWASLWTAGEKDGAENVVSGPGHLRDVSSSYVSAHDRPVVVIGLENVVVVDAGDAVLVAGMEHAQQVRPPLDTTRPDSAATDR